MKSGFVNFESKPKGKVNSNANIYRKFPESRHSSSIRGRIVKQIDDRERDDIFSIAMLKY